MVIKTDAVYRVHVPGTDIVFCMVWTGCARHNAELGCNEFLFTMDNGNEVVVPEVLMVDVEEVASSPADASSN